MNVFRAVWRWLTFDFIPLGVELSRPQRRAIHDLAWVIARRELGKWARMNARIEMLLSAVMAVISASLIILMLVRHLSLYLPIAGFIGSLIFMHVAASRYREVLRNAQLQAMNSLGVPVCSACGYLLKGKQGVPICPECGAVIVFPSES